MEGTTMASRQAKMARIAALPRGLRSPSGHYWCATCKKFFRMEEPVCPYMTRMCVNNVIPVEVVPPPHAMAYERFGLFYPKFPQRALARWLAGMGADALADVGQALAEAYLEELREWRVTYREDALEALKGFVIFLSGCEVAQRYLEEQLLFIVLDPEKVWPERASLRTVAEAALAHLRRAMAFPVPVGVDFIEIAPGPPGRYFCPMCRMYFEFGKARDEVICPLMPQKCMFEPKAISGSYPLADLVKIYRITPALYARWMGVARRFDAAAEAGVVAAMDEEIRSWGFEGTADEWASLHRLLLGRA